MSLLSKPVRVDDEKEKEEFEGVAMLHVSKQTFSSDASDFATGTLRIHRWKQRPVDAAQFCGYAVYGDRIRVWFCSGPRVRSSPFYTRIG